MTETDPTPGGGAAASDPLLEVRDLEKYYYEQDSLIDRLLRQEPVAIRAVDGVSFDIREGETLGLVGESGCGKSTTAETLMRLRKPTGGEVLFEGDDVYEMDEDTLAAFRQRAQVMFQDPFSSLDPRMTAGQIIREPLEVHRIGSKEERRERAKELLDQVGLSADQVDRYPHEFSGGQRQRIGFARALALEPDFVVLDEPVSALDVSVQAQVLNLLAEMQERLDLTYLFIAHNLSVVRHVSDRVAVMYLGEIVEIGPTEEIFENPQHPYTRALLESVPRADTSEKDREVATLRGDVPSPRNPPSGCRFRTRCPEVIPPADLDISQDAYREVMSYRDRLEREELDLEFVWEQAGDPEERDDVAAFAAAMREELFSREFSGEDRRVLEESFQALADDDRETAVELLRDRYESVCETISPETGSAEHAAACHLLEGDVVDNTVDVDAGYTTLGDDADDESTGDGSADDSAEAD